jgi:hypothetical protein
MIVCHARPFARETDDGIVLAETKRYEILLPTL